jgi:hypothetical protein
LLSLKLETKIDNEGIHYKFFPIRRRWQLITKEQVAEFTVNKKFRLLAGRIGYHQNRFQNMRSCKISGGKHLSLKLKSGEKLLLGTQNLEGMEWAMKKLMFQTEII